jgi:hypothetical protein
VTSSVSDPVFAGLTLLTPAVPADAVRPDAPPEDGQFARLFEAIHVAAAERQALAAMPAPAGGSLPQAVGEGTGAETGTVEAVLDGGALVDGSAQLPEAALPGATVEVRAFASGQGLGEATVSHLFDPPRPPAPVATPLTAPSTGPTAAYSTGPVTAPGLSPGPAREPVASVVTVGTPAQASAAPAAEGPDARLQAAMAAIAVSRAGATSMPAPLPVPSLRVAAPADDGRPMYPDPSEPVRWLPPAATAATAAAPTPVWPVAVDRLPARVALAGGSAPLGTTVAPPSSEAVMSPVAELPSNLNSSLAAVTPIDIAQPAPGRIVEALVLPEDAARSIIDRDGGISAAAADQARVAERIGEMLATRVVAHARQGHWQVRLLLNPAALGEIDVQLEMRQGALEATFHASQAQTRELLADGFPRLRATLGDAGMPVAFLNLGTGTNGGNGGSMTPRRLQNPPPDAEDAPVSETGISNNSARGTDGGFLDVRA